jgi:biopolymer transport protein ExbB/TolQ
MEIKQLIKQVLPALVIATITGLFSAVATFTAFDIKLGTLAKRVDAMETKYEHVVEKLDPMSNQVYWLYMEHGGK